MLTRKEIRDFVLPFYDKNDEAHHINHADEVCNLAIQLNDILEKKEEIVLVMLAAYFHDIYAKEREVHQKLSYKYVLESDDEIFSFLSNADRKKVAMACLQHRASFRGPFYSMLSEIISSADRGKPDLSDIMKRSKLFWMSKHGVDEAVAEVHAREHMKEKYGVYGYANNPPLYCSYFKNELKKMQEDIERL